MPSVATSPEMFIWKLGPVMPADLIGFGFRKGCGQRAVVLRSRYSASVSDPDPFGVWFLFINITHQTRDLLSFSSPHHTCLNLAENRAKANGNSWNRFVCSLRRPLKLPDVGLFTHL